MTGDGGRARVAVLLSGCGYLDGAEIHESVITLLALDRAGAEVQCFAPDKPQMHVVDHRSGEEVPGESRNVLAESSRIARGEISDLAEADAADFDAVILPGGYGAAKNLSSFATEGADCSVDPGVEELLRAAHEAGKPVGLICIAPAVGARLFPDVELTVGSDPDTAGALEQMGAHHKACPVESFVCDEKAKVVSCPAYMLGPGIKDVAAGIEKLVGEVLRLA
ncbi:MAG: isoprenoid biosynthesis protein ElbB [Deltaproteobacteria bacterium]|jgi:enhancing lycopene biosynthesis protein 2|nr:isoprenoid biosynthesis protein ElbB [Deltaproteobacteria bacterium]